MARSRGRPPHRFPKATTQRDLRAWRLGRHTIIARIRSTTIITGLAGLGATLYAGSMVYCTTSPQVVPASAGGTSSVSVPFLIQNGSRLFSMRNVTLTCRLDRGIYVDESGSQLIVPSNRSQRPPIIAEKTGITIDPGGSISVSCDEVNAIRNPGFSDKFKIFNLAQIHLELTYQTSAIPWARHYTSPKFRRSEITEFNWIPDEHEH
jgi:hypothetical protein